MPRKAIPKKSTRRGFGSIHQERNGKFSAFYNDPEGRTLISRGGAGQPTPVRHYAPITFETKLDAEDWLGRERRLISEGRWNSPEARRLAKLAEEASRLPAFETYATNWIASRKNKQGKLLAPRTRDHYTQLLTDYLTPTFGHLALDEITPQAVNAWYDGFKPKTTKKHGRPVKGDTAKAHTYSLARAVMNTAVSANGPMAGRVNPFAVRGGGTVAEARREIVATSQQVEVMLAAIRPEWRLILLLGLWCGLRYSEIAELRYGDVDLKAKVIRVRRSVSRSKVEGVRAKDPKSRAGIRDQVIPSNVLPELRQKLAADMRGKDALMFPGRDGTHLAPATFFGKVPKTFGASNARNGFYAARAAAKCPDLHFHDLRATGATLLAIAGYSIPDIQRWLGDSTPAAAMRYVRSVDGRKELMANTMSALAADGNW